MPSTTSSEVVSTPSLSAVTSMSPIFFWGCAVIWSCLATGPLPHRHDLNQLRELSVGERRRDEFELDGILHALLDARDLAGLQALLRDEVFQHQPDRRLGQARERDVARHC